MLDAAYGVGVQCMPKRLRRNRMPAPANRTWCGMEGVRALQRLPTLLQHSPAPRLWLIAEGRAVVGAAHAAALGLQGNEAGARGAAPFNSSRSGCQPAARRPSDRTHAACPSPSWHAADRSGGGRAGLQTRLATPHEQLNGRGRRSGPPPAPAATHIEDLAMVHSCLPAVGPEQRAGSPRPTGLTASTLRALQRANTNLNRPDEPGAGLFLGPVHPCCKPQHASTIRHSLQLPGSPTPGSLYKQGKPCANQMNWQCAGKVASANGHGSPGGLE